MDETYNLEWEINFINEIIATDKDTVHRLKINDVKPGMLLKKDIEWNQHVLIKKGTVLTANQIDSLKKRDIETAIVRDYEHVSYHGNALLEKVSNQILMLLEKKVYLEEKGLKLLLRYLHHYTELIQKYPISPYFLADYRDKMHDSLSAHSLRTCVYAILLADAFNKKYDKKIQLNVQDIATAALLQDIGEYCSLDTYRKNLKYYGNFNANYPGLQKEKILQAIKNYDATYNPYYAYCMLYNQKLINKSTKFMILNSKETENGKGAFQCVYMQKASHNTELLGPYYIGAEIIHLCSCFDDDLKKNLQNQISLEKVPSAILEYRRINQFHIKLLELLVETLPLYPIGTKVRINDTNGIVVANSSNFLNWAYPKILTIPENKTIDLKENHQVILDIYDKNLPLSDVINEVPKR